VQASLIDEPGLMMNETLDLRLAGDPLIADIYTPASGSNGLPVLLVHGWGGSGRYWQPTVARLRDRYQMIVPDLPGVGRSLPVQRGRNMFDQVAALEALLEHLELDRIRLVGHSMGAGIAILLAAKRPELVERLALVGVSLFRNDSERLLFSWVTEVSGLVMRFRPTELADLPLLTRQFASRFFYRVPDDEKLLRDGFLDYLRMDYDTALASARSANSPSIVEAAAQLTCPTLLVVARQDQVMPPSNVEYTINTIPGCRVHWFEECGHIPMVEKADEFADVLGVFLGE
jgi:pimeloyl-ACP methyl ester carboxylesterase